MFVTVEPWSHQHTVTFRVEFRPSPQSAWYLLETQGDSDALKTGGVFVVTVEDSKQTYFRPSHIVHGAGAVFPNLAVPDVIRSSAFTPVDSKLLVDDPISPAVQAPVAHVHAAKQGKKRHRDDDSDDAECTEARAFQRSQRAKRSKIAASSSSSSSSSSSPSSSQVPAHEEEPQQQDHVIEDAVDKGPAWQELLGVVELKFSMPTVEENFAAQLHKLLKIDKIFKDVLIAARQVIVLSSQEITAAEVVSQSTKEEYQVRFLVV